MQYTETEVMLEALRNIPEEERDSNLNIMLRRKEFPEHTVRRMYKQYFPEVIPEREAYRAYRKAWSEYDAIQSILADSDNGDMLQLSVALLEGETADRSAFAGRLAELGSIMDMNREGYEAWMRFTGCRNY